MIRSHEGFDKKNIDLFKNKKIFFLIHPIDLILDSFESVHKKDFIIPVSGEK